MHFLFLFVASRNCQQNTTKLTIPGRLQLLRQDPLAALVKRPRGVTADTNS
jgi:hypothetical protein